MERKTIVSCLLMLQFAGLSLASETALKNVEIAPEAYHVKTPSLITEDSISKATETKSGNIFPPQLPFPPATRGVDGEGETLTEDDTNRSGKLIAQYTTKTKNMFVTTTRTALSTCFSTTNVACTGGKRRKRSLGPRSIFLEAGLVPDLVASQESDTSGELQVEFKKPESDRKAKKFTIWTTLFSTHTLTSIYYYPGTTVVVSALCNLPGAANSCFG